MVSGFPGLRSFEGRALRAQLDGYIRRVVDVDVEAATPGEADKPARSTTTPYRDALERLWIVDPVPAWAPTRNPISRLIRSPKHHLADPALAARLLRVGADALIAGRSTGYAIPRDGSSLGHLFESLVALSVRVYAQASEAAVGHMQTAGGAHEVDLIVERDDHRVVAIEVKLSQAYRRRDGIAVVPAALLGP